MVVVDPNCRPWIIDAPDVYRARLEHILQMGDLVKVSEEDLDWLDPGRPTLDAARALLAYGPKVVLLTRGPEGATVVTPNGDTPVAPMTVDVVDTIGAGDAFGGGFLAWWRSQGLGREQLGDQDAVVEAARFGALVAARTCERAGASPPYLSELEPAARPAATGIAAPTDDR
jgi:fructokinase